MTVTAVPKEGGGVPSERRSRWPLGPGWLPPQRRGWPQAGRTQRGDPRRGDRVVRRDTVASSVCARCPKNQTVFRTQTSPSRCSVLQPGSTGGAVSQGNTCPGGDRQAAAPSPAALRSSPPPNFIYSFILIQQHPALPCFYCNLQSLCPTRGTLQDIPPVLPLLSVISQE